MVDSDRYFVVSVALPIALPIRGVTAERAGSDAPFDNAAVDNTASIASLNTG